MTYVSPWLKTTGILQIVGSDGSVSDLPDPANISYSVQDIDSASSGRGLDGTLTRDRVAIKEKLKVTFPPMREADAHQVLSLVSGVSFMCRFWSVRTGGYRTVEMYVGDRSASAYYQFKGMDSDLWTGLQMDFIEL
jgi:hypothetical protein